MKKNYQEKAVKINDIQLDHENPRFPPVNNQREAIQAMLSDKGERIVTLASDIYKNGMNPSSKLILFEEKGRLVDGDGNRRVTALKILETPSLSDFKPALRKKIDAILKTTGTIPSEVDCIVFNNREAAKYWISINHSGPQDGKGQIPWDSEQKDRFYGKLSIGLQALDLLTSKKLITEDDKSKVKKTTLDRLLNYKKVKKKLGITGDKELFSFGNINHLVKIVLALRDETVGSVYTAEQGAAFVYKILGSDSNGFDSENDVNNKLESDRYSDKSDQSDFGNDDEAPKSNQDAEHGSETDYGDYEKEQKKPRTRRRNNPGLAGC